MSPCAPNKTLMDLLMAASSVFMILFGIAVHIFVRNSGYTLRLGTTAAILLIVLGILQVVVVAFFPQDPMGEELTFPGKMHIALVGVQALMSILIPLFLGLWLRKTGLIPNLGTWSIIAAALTVVMGIAIFPLGDAIMGLTERLTILIYDAWLIASALTLYFFRKYISTRSSTTDHGNMRR